MDDLGPDTDLLRLLRHRSGIAPIGVREALVAAARAITPRWSDDEFAEFMSARPVRLGALVGPNAEMDDIPRSPVHPRIMDAMRTVETYDPETGRTTVTVEMGPLPLDDDMRRRLEG